jgi:hypothetical protein
MSVQEEGKDGLDKMEMMMEKVPGQGFVFEKQLIPDTRFSSRLQERLLEKVENQQKEDVKKGLWKVNLTCKNSFSLLDNELLVNLAADMGVEVSKD